VQRFVLRFTSSPSSGEYSYVVASSGVQTPRGRRNRRVHCEIFSTLEICILMGRHRQTSSAPKTIAKCKYQQMSKSFRYLFDSNSNSCIKVGKQRLEEMSMGMEMPYGSGKYGRRYDVTLEAPSFA